MNIAFFCIGLLALLLIGLGFSTSLARVKVRSSTGIPDDPKNILHKVARAHANTAEYAPVLMILFYMLAQQPQAAWVAVTIVLATACRFLLVAGLILPKTMARPNKLRFVGALGTYIFGFILGLVVIYQAF